MNRIAEVLTENNGVAPRRAFIDGGVTAYALGRARHSGEVIRIRRAWYSESHAQSEIVRAVRVGGSLGCRSALQLLGVWVQPDGLTHVIVPRNAGRLRSASSVRVSFADERADVALHWLSHPGEVSRSLQPVANALATYAECATPEFALVAMDCALNRNLLTRSAMSEAFASSTSRARKLLPLVDPDSQSGLETLARYRLRRRGVRLRTQVNIEGVGRVDVLIGDRLVLELDGFGFHATGDAFESDRHRDLALHERGYRIVRLSYRQVIAEWQDAERVILAMVRRGDHLWQRRRA